MTRHNLIQFIAAGACLGAAFLHPLLCPLAVLGLVLFIRAMVLSTDWKEAALGGFIVGIFKYSGALIWFWHAYPLTWLGVAPVLTQILLIGGVWLLSVFLIGTSVSLAAMFIFWLYRRHKNYLYLFPLVLIASEIFGSLIFSLYSLGPGSNFNIDFSFGYLGYPVSYFPGVLSIGVLGGVYALTIFTGSLALLIYLIWFKDRRIQSKRVRVLLLALIIWFIATNLYLYLRPLENLNKEIITISTRFDPELLSQDAGYEIKEEQVQEAVVAALGHDPDIILLPEDSRFVSSFTTQDEVFDFLYQAAPESNTLVADSSRAPINEKDVTLRAYLFDLKNHNLHIIDKQHFVPQGEYLPYLFTFWLNWAGQEEFVSQVTTDRVYRPGPANSYADIPVDIPSVLFCFESVIPSGVARVWREDSPNFILHPVSQAWFNDSKILRYQLDRMLRIQAIANDVHIVQAGNMAPSLVYTSRGQLNYGQALESGEYFSISRFRPF